MKLFYFVVIMFFQSLGYSQGLLLNEGDSGAMLGYGTSEISNTRLHSMFYGYSIKRKVDIGFEAGFIGENKLVGMSLSGYTSNKGPLDVRLSLLLAKIVGDDFDWDKAVNATIFYTKSGSGSTFTPHAGFTFAGIEEVFDLGFDLKLGGGHSGLLVGVDYIIPTENINYFNFRIGFLFVNPKRE